MDEPFVINLADAPAIGHPKRSTFMQEDFLVLHGRCIAVVDGKERRLHQWDFLHCRAGTDHVFVGGW